MNTTERRKIEQLVKKRAARVRGKLKAKLVDVLDKESRKPEKLTAAQQKALDALNAAQKSYEDSRKNLEEVKSKTAKKFGIISIDYYGHSEPSMRIKIDYQTNLWSTYSERRIRLDEHVRYTRNNERKRDIPQAVYSHIPAAVAIDEKIAELDEYIDDSIQLAIWLGDNETASALLAELTLKLKNFS